jgi:cobalamin biosynthetic protein CobC
LTHTPSHLLRRHGGRLELARTLYPAAPGPWIDLSTGINPEAYPAPQASLAARARLPDPHRLQQLETAAARAFGVEDPQRVVATAGSEAALRLMPCVLRSAAAVIARTTYSSHGDAWTRWGTRVSYVPCNEEAFPLKRVAGMTPGSTFILVNPNNPDGAMTPRERVLELHDQAASCDGYLLIDEAFADVAPECSVTAEAGTERYANLIVLRSFGKFYGLAGVRLGFVIAAPQIRARLRDLIGDWPLSADAIEAGLGAYCDAPWADRTRARLRTSAHQLDALLMKQGFDIVGGTSLFRLTRSADAERRFERLLNAGILVRPFEYDPLLLRFGLPADADAWNRLTAASSLS